MLFDVDVLSAEFSSVEVKFRGGQYKLGESVEQVLAAMEIARKVPDNAPVSEQYKLLPPVLSALSPELGEVVGDGSNLTLAEHLVFQRVVEEAMKRISQVPFRPVEQGT